MILNKIFVSHFVQNNTKALKEEVLWTRKKKRKKKNAMGNMTQNHKNYVKHLSTPPPLHHWPTESSRYSRK